MIFGNKSPADGDRRFSCHSVARRSASRFTTRSVVPHGDADLTFGQSLTTVPSRDAVSDDQTTIDVSDKSRNQTSRDRSPDPLVRTRCLMGRDLTLSFVDFASSGPRGPDYGPLLSDMSRPQTSERPLDCGDSSPLCLAWRGFRSRRSRHSKRIQSKVQNQRRKAAMNRRSPKFAWLRTNPSDFIETRTP